MRTAFGLKGNAQENPTTVVNRGRAMCSRQLRSLASRVRLSRRDRNKPKRARLKLIILCGSTPGCAPRSLHRTCGRNQQGPTIPSLRWFPVPWAAYSTSRFGVGLSGQSQARLVRMARERTGRTKHVREEVHESSRAVIMGCAGAKC